MVPVFKRISLDMTSSTPSSLFDHYFHFIFFRFLILWHPSAKPVYDVNLEYTLSCCDSVYSRFAYLVYFRWKQIKYLPPSFILKCELSARVCSRRITDKLRWHPDALLINWDEMRRITDKLRWDATWVRLGSSEEVELENVWEKRHAFEISLSADFVKFISGRWYNKWRIMHECAEIWKFSFPISHE